MTRFLSAAIAAPCLLLTAPAFASGRMIFASLPHFDPAMYLVAVIALLVVCASLFRGFRGAFIPLAVLLAVSLCLDVAFAADAAAPETVAQAAGTTTQVTWAYGAAISQWATAIGTILFAVVMWALRLLPGQVGAIITATRADQIIQQGINYGINMVEGATKDKALTVDVHNLVLAQAVQYVIDHAPGWLQSWMGGPELIAQKVIARLNLAPDAVPNANAAINTAAPSAG